MPIISKKKFFVTFSKYFLGGGIAALIDLSVLYVCVEFGNIHYLLAGVLGFIISFCFAFFFQKYITFQNTQKKHLRQGTFFLLFQLIGLGINLCLLYICVDIFEWNYMYSAVMVKGWVFAWNFSMNYFFNFK